MYRKRIGIFISIATIGIIQPLHAQEAGGSCNACETTPPTIQAYYDFVQEAVSILGDDYSEDSVSPGAPFAGSFTTQGLTLQNSNIFSTIYKNNKKRIIENYTFATNTIRVLTNSTRGIIDNITRGMMAMRKSTIKRDLDKIATLDPMIDTLTLSIGRAGLADTPLQEKTYQALTQAAANRKNTLFENVNLGGATYGNMIRLLNHLQAQMKDALIFNQNDHAINNDRLIIKGESVQLTISDEAKIAIKKDYACVRTQQCNANVSKVKGAIGKARKSSTKEAGNAIQEFVMGWKTLKKVFSRKTGKLSTAEEKAIDARIKELRRVHGGGYAGTGSRLNFSFRSNFSTIIKDIKDRRKTEKNTKRANTKEGEYPQEQTKLINQRTNNLDKVNRIIEVDRAVLTTQFPQDQTQTITESILVLQRTYKTTEESNKEFSTTCQLQCNNKGGVCQAP